MRIRIYDERAKAHSKKHYDDNKEKILAKRKAYRQEHKEELKAKRDAVKERRKANNALYRANNKDKIAAANKRYKEAHHEEVLKKSAAYRARMRAEGKKRPNYYKPRPKPIEEEVLIVPVVEEVVDPKEQQEFLRKNRERVLRLLSKRR